LAAQYWAKADPTYPNFKPYEEHDHETHVRNPGARVSRRPGCRRRTRSAQSGKVDITGKWTFNVQTDAGSGTPTVTFKQDGSSPAILVADVRRTGFHRQHQRL
jgi:hypothetical protein